MVFGGQFCNVGVVLEAPDIVDQIGARLQRGFGDGSFVGIDGYGNVKAALDRLDHRRRAGDLLFLRDHGMSRTGGFSADINDIRSVPEHFLRVVKGVVQAVEFSAVGEGIRRHVEDSHQICPVRGVKIAVSYFHNLPPEKDRRETRFRPGEGRRRVPGSRGMYQFCM